MLGATSRSAGVSSLVLFLCISYSEAKQITSCQTMSTGDELSNVSDEELRKRKERLEVQKLENEVAGTPKSFWLRVLASNLPILTALIGILVSLGSLGVSFWNMYS